MKYWWKKNISYWPELVLGLMVISEIFFRLTRGAILNDDATYAFRSVNLVDFLASNNQTTPWQWFNPLPWWVGLSFHDAPGLFFWLEHIFFTIFGVTSWSATLLPAVSGGLSALAVYLLVRYLTNRSRALLAVIIILCLNPFIWLHRLALLESLMVPLVLFAWYAYLRAALDKRWYWLAGLAGGLAMMTKYTASFFLFAVIIHFCWQRSKDWQSRHWWGALATLIVIISPMLLYNYWLFQTRGHFDVQLAAALGQSNQDWPILSTHINTQFFAGLGPLIFSLGFLYSWPILIIFLWAVFRLNHYRDKKKNISADSWFTIVMFCCWLLVIIATRTNDRFVATGYIFPIVAICASWPENYWRRWSPQQKAYSLIISIVLLFSWTYTVNTNYVERPWGRVNINYSDSRRENYGLAEVEQILQTSLIKKKPVVVLWDSLTANFDPSARNNKLFDPESVPLAENADEAAPIIIYDRNMNWFTSLWYFYRWPFYHGHVVLNSYQASSLLADPKNEFLSAVQGRPYILFMTTDYSLRDSLKYQSLPSPAISELQDKSHLDYIFDNYGQPVWEVYTGRF